MRKVPLLDLKAQYESIRGELEPALLKSLQECHYIMGPEVTEFEGEVAKYCGAKHAVSCANGSDALRLALMAFDIGEGDEVIIPTYTFFATAGAVSLVGAKPVFCDVEPTTYNINVEQIERLITPRTKAIIPVHLYGQMADMDPVLEIARRHNLKVIEDGAQAIGAGYKKRPMGNFGHISTLSFFPSKNLGCAGDGGAMLTNDDALAEKLRVLRLHGSKPKYHHSMIGFNSRLDTLQAAVLRVKLRHLDSWTKARNENACRYHGLLAKLEEKELVRRPTVAEHTSRHVFNQYVIRVKNRDALKAFLTERGVGTEVYYPIPLHLQKCYEHVGLKAGSLKVAEDAALSTLAIPIYSELTQDQQQYVAATIAEFYGQAL